MRQAAVTALTALLPGTGRPRLRLGLGAAVGVGLLALTVSIALSATSGATQLLPAAPPRPGSTATPSGPDVARPSGTARFLVVHVVGAVRQPGIYQLPDGARTIDAVAAAGGLADDADPAGLNLASSVRDGQQLDVPAVGETMPAAPDGAAEPGRVAPVRLNSATVAELDGLPRIGPQLAQRIIDWRNTNGPFQSVDQLADVPGIGEKTLAGLRELVTL